MSNNCSKIVEPAHILDVDAGFGSEIPCGAEECGRVTVLECGERSTIDGDPVRRRRGKLVPVEAGVYPCDGCLGAAIVGSFTGNVSRVEFREGSVDVVGVK